MHGIPRTEGRLPFRGHKTWFRIYGNGEMLGKLPILALHGGPGACHDYLESLADLARNGRRVIFYDQLGCGNSDHVDDPSLWTVELFIEEINTVRQALGLRNIHLLGQSWGGMLAMEYMLTKPEGVQSLIIASSPSSMPLWVEEANRLRDELPPEIQETLLRHEEAGTTDSKEYHDAMMAFYDRHVCRVKPWPDYVARSFAKMDEFPQVYHTMNGPSEFHVVGTLKDWDVTPRLGEIDVPTMVTSGRYDEATPLIAGTVHEGIRNSEWVIFENSSHMAHVEERVVYNGIVEEFVQRIERGGTSNGQERSAMPGTWGARG